MLKFKYLIPLSGMVLSVAVIAFQYVSLSAELRDREIDHARQTLVNTANNLQGALNERFENQDMVGVRQDLSDINFLPLAQLAFLVDDRGTIMASSELGLIGLTPDNTAAHVAAGVIDKVRAQNRGVVVEGGKAEMLVAVYPVIMGRKPGEFRPSKIGAAVIVFDPTAKLETLQSSVLSTTMKSAMGVIVVLVILVAFMNLRLTKRVNRIIAVAQDFMSGNLDARIGLKGGDELAVIADAFDGAADSVASAQSEIKTSQQSLNNAQRMAHLGNWR